MTSTSGAYYGEMYLGYLHRQGYPPTDKDRMEFNHRFYSRNRDRIPYPHQAVLAVSHLHHSIKTNSMPAWVKRDAGLRARFLAVLADYRQKYESTAVPAQESVIQPVQNDRNDESMEEMNISMPPEVETEPLKEMAIPLMVERNKEDLNESINSPKEIRKSIFAQVREERRDVIPDQNTAQTTAPAQKNQRIKAEPVSEAATNENTGENDQVQKKIQQLEKEAKEKDTVMLEWKRNCEEEQKKTAERIAQLEQMVKAAQLHLATKNEAIRLSEAALQVLKEKMELKDIIIREKERTIQILSSQGR